MVHQTSSVIYTPQYNEHDIHLGTIGYMFHKVRGGCWPAHHDVHGGTHTFVIGWRWLSRPASGQRFSVVCGVCTHVRVLQGTILLNMEAVSTLDEIVESILEDMCKTAQLTERQALEARLALGHGRGTLSIPSGIILMAQCKSVQKVCMVTRCCVQQLKLRTHRDARPLTQQVCALYWCGAPFPLPCGFCLCCCYLLARSLLGLST